ncbi:MAG: ABC transporter ATP-binding protein [Verrucomicrobiaceae bacterium]|nr:ABC transporter ATP-binding protein [Verrucomicrobiaceae bacterium]
MSLLRVEGLQVHFPVRSGLFGRRGDVVKAVDDVSFSITEGKTLGLVGESGSGKSTVARALLKLTPPTGGKAWYEDKEILGMSEGDFRPLRKDLQMVFQDPIGSLNPRMTVGRIITEPLNIHFKAMGEEEQDQVVAALLGKVGLPEDAISRYPHEFSGGQRQRIGIARALAVKPRVLICDEPVSALDVSVQAQILNLLKDLQEELKLTLLFIAHDLAVVRHMSDDIAVMNRGRIVESGAADALCDDPQHEYTRRLLGSIPKLSLSHRAA